MALAGASAASADTGMTATPAPTASVSGVITDAATGTALAGATATAYTPDGSSAGSGTSGPDGVYVVGGLDAGDYVISISATDHGPVFWPSAASPADATMITLAAGEARAGVDAALTPEPTATPTPTSDPTDPIDPTATRTDEGETASPTATPTQTPDASASPSPSPVATTAPATSHTVSGRVTADSTGSPISGISVSASGTNAYRSQTTDADGRYTITVPDGTYHIYFYDGSRAYAPEYWDNTYDYPGTALDVSSDTTGINGSLATAGAIAGHVTGGASGYVDAYRETANGLSLFNEGSYSSTGEYRVSGLAPGNYLVEARPNGGTGTNTYYRQSYDAAGAQVVSVVAGGEVDGIDIQLLQGYSLSGAVTGYSGSHPVYVQVESFDTSGNLVYSHRSPVTAGQYSASNLPPGSYRVSAYAQNDDFGAVYDNESSLATADLVIISDSDKTGIDLVLKESAHISGTISTSGTPPVESASITAYLWNGTGWDEAVHATGWSSWSLGGLTDLSGYSRAWLGAGTYTVGFSSDPRYPNSYCPQYFSGHGSIDDADSFTLNAGETKSGVDAVLSTTCTTPSVTPGTVTVTGTAAVGQTLTANPGDWEPVPIQLAYQWSADGTPISGATNSTLTLDPSLAGKSVTVAVTGSRPGYDSATASSTAVTVQPGTLTTGTPTISGTAQAGQTLTASPGTWGPTPVAFSYQWNADGTPITGATSSTFVPSQAQVGATITVDVTGSKAGYSSATVRSAGTGPVTAAPLLQLQPGTPTITGTPQVGATLQVSPGDWEPAPVTLTYQWYRGTTPITGATGTSYSPQAADIGAVLSVTVTGTKSGYNPATRTATSSGAVTAGTITAGTPTISGTARVGETLTASPGSWTPADVTFGYQWLADGTPIAGATGATFLVGPDQLGAHLSVVVTGSKSGYDSKTARSASTGAVAAGTLTTGTPTISGQPVVGSTLTADPGTWEPSGVALTYQWQRGGHDIVGATGSTYVPTGDDVGSPLTVVVTGAAPGYHTASATSAATAAVSVQLTVTPASIVAGGSVTVAGAGFAPGEPIQVSLQSATAPTSGSSEPAASARTTTSVHARVDAVAGAVARAQASATTTVTVVATPQGTFSVAMTIPSGTAAGAYHVVGIGTMSGRTGSAALAVTAAVPSGSTTGTPSGSLPRTGVELPTGLAVAAILCLLAGIVLRRKAARSQAE